MVVENGGIEFDFRCVAPRTIEVKDDKDMVFHIDVNITDNICFHTTRYKGKFHFGKTKMGRSKRKCDYNAFFECLEENGIPVSINYIPSKGLFMVNRLEKVVYLSPSGKYNPISKENLDEVVAWEEPNDDGKNVTLDIE